MDGMIAGKKNRLAAQRQEPKALKVEALDTNGTIREPSNAELAEPGARPARSPGKKVSTNVRFDPRAWELLVAEQARRRAETQKAVSMAALVDEAVFNTFGRDQD